MNSAYVLTKGGANEAKKTMVYKDFKEGLSEVGIIDNDGNALTELHLERFTLDTRQVDITHLVDATELDSTQTETIQRYLAADTNVFRKLYKAIAYIDTWILRSDNAPETYPHADKMKNIFELHIEKGCTSFNGDDIQPQLKNLTNVERIYIKVTVEQISRAAICQLANLNEKPMQFFVENPKMHSYVFATVFGAKSKVKGLVELIGPNDRIGLNWPTKTINLQF